MRICCCSVCSVWNVRGNSAMTRSPWCTDYFQKSHDLSEGMLLCAQFTSHHSNHFKNLLQERVCKAQGKQKVNPYHSYQNTFDHCSHTEMINEFNLGKSEFPLLSLRTQTSSQIITNWSDPEIIHHTILKLIKSILTLILT